MTRLSRARTQALREIARREGIPVKALIERWIDENIETERKLEKLLPGQTLRRVLVRRRG